MWTTMDVVSSGPSNIVGLNVAAGLELFLKTSLSKDIILLDPGYHTSYGGTLPKAI